MNGFGFDGLLKSHALVESRVARHSLVAADPDLGLDVDGKDVGAHSSRPNKRATCEQK